jgi:hypothetical protein
MGLFQNFSFWESYPDFIPEFCCFSAEVVRKFSFQTTLVKARLNSLQKLAGIPIIKIVVPCLSCKCGTMYVILVAGPGGARRSGTDGVNYWHKNC